MKKLNRRFRSKIVDDTDYRGYPLMRYKGPFVGRYLDRIIDVMNASLVAHPRTFAVRFDLRVRDGEWMLDEDRLIDRFLASLKTKIKIARDRAVRESNNGWAHKSDVRYFWAREYGESGSTHFHFVLFLNRDAFNAIGNYGVDKRNLFSRILEAWASAQRLTVDEALGLVYVPRNASYWIDADDQDMQDELFYRASYLAKVSTKQVGRRHSFGSSR